MKKTNILILILLLILIDPVSCTYADTINKNDTFNVLLINSYDTDDNWEVRVKEGLKEVIKTKKNINLKTEYLDIRNNNSDSYIKEFSELLNAKYKSKDIDAVITVDDEAFQLIRHGLFKKDSVFYKKIIIFTGVNDRTDIREEEKKYITGFVDERSKMEIIDLINKLHPSVKNIDILLDYTTYSKNLKNKILENTYLLDEKIKLNFIQGKYESEVLEKLEKNSTNDSVLLVCSLYKDKNTNRYVNPSEFIKKIKNIKNKPIYTSLEEYIGVGTVGGHIDIGKQCGEALGKMVLKVYKENGISNVSLINRLGGNYVVDYKKIYEYNINPLNVPRETIIINRKPYEPMLPRNQIIMLMVFMIIILLSILYIIYLMLIHKKNYIKNKRLYKITKEREQLKTDFIANMSHELRTPLNIIKSASTLLELKVNKNEQVEKEYILDKVERINKNSDRLIRLINNLIDITKFDSGFYECKSKNENIVYVVEDIVFATIDFASAKNIELIFDTDSEEIITCIDKEKIERVILNLLSNAIKFTNQNGKIEVFIKNDSKFVYIYIKDNGIGIPKEKVNHIFSRFYQVDSILSRKSEGSGIGLCLVDEIIKMHGGKISVESEENKGTTFEIVLNIEKDDDRLDEIDDKTDRNINDVVKLEMANI